MLKTRVIQKQDVGKEQWDKFVIESPYGWAFHLYDVISVDRYKEDKDISFAIYDEDKGQIALIAMLHIEYKESGNLLHSRYGIVPRSGLAHKEQKKLCNAYKEYIDSLCVKYNIKRLLAGTVPIAEALQPQKKELVNPLMEYGYCPAATTPTYTWVCDINGDEEELIKKCEQTTRQALRKLEQSNKYEIIEADNNPEDYDDYVRLHIETYTRTGLADEILSDEYQRNIFNNMIPQGICRVFFLKEKEIYAQLLEDPDTEVRGTVKELAEKYNVDIMTMTGFLDGINDSLVEANPIEEMEEDTPVSLKFDKALLYKNMVGAEADWLYGLPQWEKIFDEETRKALYKEQKSSTTIVKEQKIYPNDPCPCGSGKKYKKCCGRNK